MYEDLAHIILVVGSPFAIQIWCASGMWHAVEKCSVGYENCSTAAAAAAIFVHLQQILQTNIIRFTLFYGVCGRTAT